MKKLLLALLVVIAALASLLLFERLFVEKTFGPSAVLMLALLGLAFVVLLATFLLYDTRHRTTLGNVWLAGFSTLTAYVVLDVIAGFLLIRPLSPPLVPDLYRHHKLVPNSNAQFQQRDFSYIQRVNNLGLRGRDTTLEKPAGTYRILMLGDSFTMGKGVSDDQTFSVLLERALNDRVKACQGPLVEVLNGGVDSYAPILSHIELTRDLQPTAPDLIVLNLDVSDLVQETAYRKIAVTAPDGSLAVPQEPARESLTERIRNWTDHHLFLTRLALYYVNELAGYRSISVRSVVTQANFEVVAHTLAQDDEPRDQQWSDIFESLGKIKAWADAHGATFILTIYPWAHQISDTEWMPGRYNYMPKTAVASDKSRNTVHARSEQSGIQLIDMTDEFRSHLGEGPLYFQYDNHWTPKGQEVMAKGLEASLARQFMGQWCKGAPD